ncbi:DUF6000 family protein [Hymenobacter terrenus]|uniref:DUF6000 family protein n=1 Tax=Hymenobacter terrenus TaxID=1629124 RepID=UPI0006989349|nr:DUF6000 family protein [Hymenobacter terrenus]
MTFSKLWQKLFNKNDEATEIALHVSGATIRNKSPFDDLESYRNEEELSEELIEKWVMDFYMVSINNLDNESFKLFVDASKEITPEIVRQLLGDFDWRPRIVGAYFAAIKNYSELRDIIGVHLLKSEVCYAGAGYALALAVFGDDKSKDYLNLYLTYYLERKDLWFDQGDALAALYKIDPSQAAICSAKWHEFVADKPNWNLEDEIAAMNRSVNVVKDIGEASQTH